MENNNFIFFDGRQFQKGSLQGEQNPAQQPPPNPQSHSGDASGYPPPPVPYGAYGVRPQMPFNNQYSVHHPPFDTSYMAGALHHQPDMLSMPYNSQGLHQFSVSPHFNYNNNNNNHTPSSNAMLPQYPQAWSESRPVSMAPAAVRQDMGVMFMGDQVPVPAPIGAPSGLYQQEEFLPRHFDGQENADEEPVVMEQRSATKSPVVPSAKADSVPSAAKSAAVSQIPTLPREPQAAPQPQPPKKDEGPTLDEVDKAVFSEKEREALAKKPPYTVMRERIYALLKKRTESMATSVELFKKTILACRKEKFGATDPDEIQVAFDMADKSVTSRFWADFRNANHFLSRMRNWIAAMIKMKRYDSTKSALKALTHIPFTEQTLRDLKLKVVLDILEKRGDTLTSKLATRALQSALKKIPAKTAASRTTPPADKNPVKLGIASAQKQASESNFFKSLQNAQQTSKSVPASKKRDASAIEAPDTKVVKKPAANTYSFASHLQTLKRGPLKQSPPAAEKKEEEKPKNKPTKTVHWKDEDSLVEVKYFELFPEEISSRKRLRDVKDLDHEEALALHNEASENTGPPVDNIEWYDPPKLEVSESQREMPIKRGGDVGPESPAAEAELQRQSESFVRTDTPDTPDEPEFHKETRNETVIMVLPDRITKDQRMDGFLQHIATTGVEPLPPVPEPLVSQAPAAPIAPAAQEAMKMLTQLINANKSNPAVSMPQFDMSQMQSLLNRPPPSAPIGPSYGPPQGPSHSGPNEDPLANALEMRKRDVRPDVANDMTSGYKHRYPCAYFKKGRCTYGNDCNFIHLRDE